MSRPTSIGRPMSETTRRRVEAEERTYELREKLYDNPLLWVQVTTAEDEDLKWLLGGSTDWSRIQDYAKKIWWRYNITEAPQSWWRRFLGLGG